jgi:hypothetical protein
MALVILSVIGGFATLLGVGWVVSTQDVNLSRKDFDNALADVNVFLAGQEDLDRCYIG